MNNLKLIVRVLTVLVILSLSCSFATGLFGGENGPENFTAVLTAPDVVLLKWDAVEGATEYILELSIDDGDSFSIITLAPEYTSYEDLSAPEEGNLVYMVQAVTESGSAGKSEVSIITGERVPNPLTVKPEFDEVNAIATQIGIQGGTVSLIDSKGVEFILSIPQGALFADTEIRMTAVNSIQDWPLDGDAIGAVRLEPAGLILNDVAILTIDIPVDVDSNLAIVGFAFDADGQEFHLQPSDEENGLTDKLPSAGAHLASLVFQQPKHRIVMPVMELKVSGIGQTSDHRAANLVKDHAPSDSGAAMEHKWAAEEIADDELAPVKKNTDPVREQAYEIGKEIFLAKNCKDLNSQIVSFQKWRFTRDYQSLSDDQKREYTKQIWDELVDKVKEVLENAATDCEKSKESGGSSASLDSPCANELLKKITNPPSGTVSDFNSDLKNKLENKLSSKELQDIKDKLEKCMSAAYLIVGGAGDWQTSTAICDIMKPFTLTGGGFAVNFSGGLSGTYNYSGPMNSSGGQSYSISLPNGIGMPGTMSGGGVGCVNEVCKDGTESYDLTPIDPATGCSQ